MTGIAQNDKGLKIPGLEVARGTRGFTRIRVLEMADGARVEIPVIVARGEKPGPIFYMGAAFHGDEVNGVEIVARLAQEVDLAALSGTVIAVPVQNPLAFQVQHRYYVGHVMRSPLDQSPADPWVCFPGEADGNMAMRIAHVIFNTLMRHADYYIDIHTPTTGGRYAPFAFLPPPRVGEIVEKSEAMARAFGADFILKTNDGVYVQEPNPHTICARLGKIAMGIEIGEGGRLEADQVQRGVDGLENVLRHVGMLPGAVHKTGRQMVIRDQHVVRATRGGLHHRHVELNQDLKRGDLCSTIVDVTGNVVEEIRAPIDGAVVRIATVPIVNEGDRVVQLSVPV